MILTRVARPRHSTDWVSRGRNAPCVVRMAHAANAFSIESLPLFATDEVIGAALLGANRVQEWRQMVPLLEARGFPKIDALMGGRYTPAVRAYFDHQYGLDRDRSGDAPLAPDGVEDFEAWKQKRRS
jgi:hypothetical protein